MGVRGSSGWQVMLLGRPVDWNGFESDKLDMVVGYGFFGVANLMKCRIRVWNDCKLLALALAPTPNRVHRSQAMYYTIHISM